VPHGTFQVGSAEVVPLCDGWAPLPLDDEMPGAGVDWDADRTRHPWAYPGDDTEHWAWHVHSFLIRQPAGLVLVDTGMGHLGRPPYDVVGRLEDELASVGVGPEEVDHVVLTHLHADHSGGACRQDGSPRFPNARYHVHPEDWSYFAEHRTPEDFSGRFAMAEIEARGMLDLDPTDNVVLDGISLVHSPGHTPGHRAVRVDQGVEPFLLVGDLLHVPPQIAQPDRPSNHDEDPELGARQRARLLASAARERWILGVSHFGRPFGRVTDDGWRSA
jgi:glyoxylase-like metal-dependent hydrolase (beta-lactamase superfamily II)